MREAARKYGTFVLFLLIKKEVKRRSFPTSVIKYENYF
jgi:hypothetical protein